MHDIDLYRARADEMKRSAEKADAAGDPEIASRYREIEKHWRELADSVEALRTKQGG